MHTYMFELNDIEAACGVTIEQVQREIPRVLVRDGRVYVGGDVPPALSSAVARCALGLDAVDYAGRNRDLGLTIWATPAA